MALAHSPRTVTNGLVFYMDQGNPSKSWKGAPTTNVIETNISLFASDSGCTIELQSYTFQGQPVYRVTFPAGTLPSIRTNFSYTTGQQFTGSIYYRVVSSGSHTVYLYFRESGFGTAYVSTALTSTDWTRANISYTFASSGTSMFLLYQSNSAATQATVIDFCMPQVELGSFATPFVAGTRTNTQALLDLTGQNTITAASLTYASDNTFAFDGANNYMHFSKNRSDIGITNTYSLETVFKRNTTDSGRIIFGGQGWNWGIMSTTNGCRVEHFYSSNGGTSYNYLVSNDNVVSTGTWVHVVATFNHLGNMCTYINGKLTATTNMSAYTNYWYNSPFCIGGYNYAPYRFNGQIPIAKVYAKELTAIEVAQNFNALRGRYGI